jgi:Rrf2 family protein
MFKLNRKVEYALIALKHMVRKSPGELTTAKELADTYGCSFDTIARVLQTLAQKNWLQSSQGASGGYLIIKDIGKLSFLDLSEILLGPMKFVRCFSSSCKIKSNCNIISPVQNLNKHLQDLYKGLSIKQLLEEDSINQKNHPRLRPQTATVAEPQREKESKL